MSEVCCFSDTMPQNSHAGPSAQGSIKIAQSHLKLWHQITSTSTSTSFLTPPPPLYDHSLPPSSALANVYMWANPGQPGQPQQSQAPSSHHLSAATPTLSASSTTIKTMTTTQEDWRSVRRMGKRGTGGQKDDDNAVCNPTCYIINFFFILFSFLLFDNTVCNPYTVLSIFIYFLFPSFC